MKKYSELKEDLGSALVSGIFDGIRSSSSRPDAPAKSSGRFYDHSRGSATVRTARLDYDFVKLMNDWCKEMGYDVYPNSRSQEVGKWGFDQYHEKRDGWTGSPRHTGGLGADVNVHRAGDPSPMPIATFERGSPESTEFFAAMMRLNDMAKQRRLHLSVGCGTGYMGNYTMHVDVARGTLQIPFPYETDDGRLTTRYVESEYAGQRWWEDGRRTGVLKVGRDYGKPSWGKSRPAWLWDLGRHLY